MSCWQQATQGISIAESPAAPGWIERVIRASGVRRAYWNWATRQARQRPYLQMLARCARLEGDIVECGVFRGQSLLRMAAWLQQQGIRKTVHGLDSFTGFPREEVGASDLAPGRSLRAVRGRFRTAASAPRRILRVSEDLELPIRLHVGYFDETLPRLIASGRRLCFAHLDCDIYESYRFCLEQLYSAMAPGGVILFDEYRSPSWPGATRAIDEFFAARPEKPQICRDAERPAKPKYFVVKVSGQ
ncbi:MAG TPA: TylF/MycF/NovP-related O-methyltransferase [Pirellulaceae bacterium]|nr:TylF/MycF/NovP-related O-methyltransferase [Pirellulaceae bacterium]